MRTVGKTRGGIGRLKAAIAARRVPARRLVACAASAAAFAAAGLVHATELDLKATDNATVQPGGPRTGANGKGFFNLESDGNTTNASFGILDFGAINIGNNVVSSINSIELDLFDSPAAFSSTNGLLLDFYLTTDTATNIQPTVSPLKYQTGVTPQGSGTQVGGLTLLGSGVYSKTTTGNQFSYSLTNSAAFNATSASGQYLLSQINAGGTVRLLAVIDPAQRTNAVAATFAGYTSGTNAPTLKLDLTETAQASNDSNVYLTAPGNTSASVSLGRVIQGVNSATSPILVGNTGTSTAKIVYDTTGGGVGSIAPNNASIAGGGTGTLSAGLSAAKTNVSLGSGVTGVLQVVNQANTNQSTLTVNVSGIVVGTRLIRNDTLLTGTNATDFGKILVGTTVTNTVTVNTQNTNAPATPDYLTTVQLASGATASFTNTTYTLTGTNLSGAVTFDADQSATFALAAKPIKSGSVGLGTNAAFLRFSSTNSANGVTGEGLAGENDYIFNYAQFVGYAPASLTGTSTATSATAGTFALNNAAANDNGTNSLRLGATVTAQSVTAQSGFTISSLTGQTVAIPTGTTTGSTLAGNYSFASTGKLNGTYRATVALTAQNFDGGQGVQGLAANDLGTTNVALAASVTGNSGNGTANILPGGSYGGYFINRGAGSNTTIQFLGGTSSTNTNLGVAFSTSASHRAAGDAAAVTGTGTDAVVVQFNYNPALFPAALTAAVAVGFYDGTKYVNAAGTSTAFSEVRGAYDNNLTVGRYGINAATHTVWAVVNKGGTFTPYLRAAGDTRFRGIVDSTDINQIVQRGHYNDGTSGNTWSDGDFTGDGVVNSTDINAIVQAGAYNVGVYDSTPAAPVPAASLAAVTLTSTASPSATTVGAAGDGLPDYRYTPATGDLTFVRDSFDTTKKIQTLTLRSLGNKFITGVGYTSNNNSGVDVDQTDEQFAARFNGIATNAASVFDLGPILPANLTPAQLAADLSLFYDYSGDGASGDGIPADLTVVGTPEPATLSLVGLTAAGLLARRRRNK